MGNLEKFTKENSKTVEAIEEAWKKRKDAEPNRGYIGASIIGHHCSRGLWYNFRWCGREQFSGRMYRLFDRGDVEEPRMIADLKSIGCTVHEIDPRTGEQFEVKAVDGHFSGHMDGCALGIPEAPKTWHVLEFKTHNTRSFRKLVKSGVRESKPMHYAQMQIYMHLTGMNRALYMAVNKDDETLYTERIKLNKAEAKALLAKAERVVYSNEPPLRAGKDPGANECKYCNFINLCHSNPMGVAVPCEVTCRSCEFARPTKDGDWTCIQKQKTLSTNDQIRACCQHLFNPDLITFAKVIDLEENPDGSAFIEYRNNINADIWANGSNKKMGQYDSYELTKMPYADISNMGVIHKAKNIFQGEVK